MPSIAQQDYLKIVGKSLTDANLFAGVAKAIQAGTIFDTILQWENVSLEIEQARVIGITEATAKVYVYVYEPYNDEMKALEILMSANNYRALAAVQAGGAGYIALPVMTTTQVQSPSGPKEMLVDDITSGSIVCNGKWVGVTLDDGKITAVEITDIDPPTDEAVYEVSEDDLPYFIGMPEI